MAQSKSSTQAPSVNASKNGVGHIDPTPVETDASEQDALESERLKAPLILKSPAWDSDEPEDFQALKAPGFMSRKSTSKPPRIREIASRRISPQEYVWIWPGDGNGESYGVVRDRNDRDKTYIVPNDQYDVLAKHVVYAEMWLVKNNVGDIFFVTVPVVTYSGGTNGAWDTFRTEFMKASEGWQQFTWNAQKRCHEADPPVYPIPNPEWGIIDYGVLFGAAFKGLVLRPGHPFRTKILGGSPTQTEPTL
jgi:hypothetical protein